MNNGARGGARIMELGHVPSYHGSSLDSPPFCFSRSNRSASRTCLQQRQQHRQRRASTSTAEAAATAAVRNQPATRKGGETIAHRARSKSKKADEEGSACSRLSGRINLPQRRPI